MRNPAKPSFIIPDTPRWVRYAMRTEARKLGWSLGDLLAFIVERHCDETVVKVAKARAQMKLYTGSGRMSGLTRPLPREVDEPTAHTLATMLDDEARLLERVSPDPGVVAPRRPGIHLAPDDE